MRHTTGTTERCSADHAEDLCERCGECHRHGATACSYCRRTVPFWTARKPVRGGK